MEIRKPCWLEKNIKSMIFKSNMSIVIFVRSVTYFLFARLILEDTIISYWTYNFYFEQKYRDRSRAERDWTALDHLRKKNS